MFVRVLDCLILSYLSLVGSFLATSTGGKEIALNKN